MVGGSQSTRSASSPAGQTATVRARTCRASSTVSPTSARYSSTICSGEYAAASRVLTRPARGAFIMIARIRSSAARTGPPILEDAAEDVPGRPERSAQRAGDLRLADARVIADGDLDNPLARDRAAQNHLHRPSIARLAELQRAKRIAAR